ncbi:MAG TPA: GH25 family lysozyme [Bellilinea sp.]|nr:GH25 family lysozyme [Bellilinea sp.]
MNAQGPDISLWQDKNSTPQMFDPWKARAKGASFVGIKTSQGSWADPDYAQNWARCRPVLYRMPYHFLTWDISVRRQAELFWSLLERDTFGLLPLTCDFEWWRTVPTRAMDLLYGFMERLKTLASPLPMQIYTAKTFWDPNGSKSDYWKQYHLWLCDIVGLVEIPKPWTAWTFHQYTFKLPGLEWGAESLDLDGNYYNGTLEQMKARFNLPELDAPVVAPEPVSGLRMRVIGSGLRVREAPSLDAAVVDYLGQGQVVDVQEVVTTDSWAKLGERRYATILSAGKPYLEKV